MATPVDGSGATGLESRIAGDGSVTLANRHLTWAAALAVLSLWVAGNASAGAPTLVSGFLTGSPTVLGGTMNFPPQTLGATSPAQTETVNVVMSATNGGNPVAVPPGYVTRFVGASIDNPDFAITGGSCAPLLDIAPGGSCTLQLAFTPSAQGSRNGILSVQCTVVALVGVITLACDNLSHPFMLLAGAGNAIAAAVAAVPALGAAPLTALALLLFGGSVLAMRRRR
jgi:hypothetical protein